MVVPCANLSCWITEEARIWSQKRPVGEWWSCQPCSQWSQGIYHCPSCTLQWRSHAPIQMFHLLEHFCYLLSHLLLLCIAVAEQWWDLHVDTEERQWMRPNTNRTSGPESGCSTWCPCGFSATKIAAVDELCCPPEAPHLEFCTCLVVCSFC